MATARPHKRITRKELRQPDWFQIRTERIVEFYRDHRIKVIGVVIVSALILVGILVWDSYRDYQNLKASEEFGRAIRFHQSGKHAEAIAAFESVTTYRWSPYARFAYLYQTNGYLALNDLDKAVAAAQRFLVGTADNTLYRQIGLVTLAYVEERRGQLNDALQHYTEAERINAAYRERALLGKARVSEQAGDLKGAIAAYREYVRENAGSPYGLKVAELEAKLVPASEGKQ